MVTLTLTNLNTAEHFRSTTLVLTDRVVTGSGTITVLIGIDAAAGTLDYLPATTGNVQLFELGAGQFLLEGSETELSSSLAKLGFAPSASSALTINLAAAANINVITSGALAGASWQNFENLDGSAWDKNLTVIANAAGSFIATGGGLDTITLGAGVDNIRGDGNDVIRGNLSANDRVLLDVGNDTITLPTTAIAVTFDGGAGSATLTVRGSAAQI